MKLKGRNYTIGGEGYVVLIPENGDDIWHAYNLIRSGDIVTATTYRKVQREKLKRNESTTMRMKLSIDVETIDFDTEGSEIRVKGRNISENEHVKLGAYHTLEIDVNREFKLKKALWDSLDLDRIKQSCDLAMTADLAILLINDGFSFLTLIGNNTTLEKSRIEIKLPTKKGVAGLGYDKSYEKFLEKVYKSVIDNVDFEIVKCFVIAGPGNAKDQFKRYLLEECLKKKHKHINDNKDRIVAVNATSSNKAALNEVLNSQTIMRYIKDTKAAKEIKVLDEFQKLLAHDSTKAFYGAGHVFAAAEMGAIHKLLLIDSLFRSVEIKKRQKYVAFVEDLRKGGVEVHIFSSAHVTGEALNKLTGIAAILRFPLPDLEDQELPEPF